MRNIPPDHLYPNGVREARLAQRPPWSQAQLARIAGLHRSQVCRIEAGWWIPRDTTQQKLALALDVDREELFPQSLAAVS